MDTWNNEIIILLNKIRINSITLSNRHRTVALQYQSVSKYFDIPVIVLSTFASSASGISYMENDNKSQINLFISMFITILTSIKLYLNITSNLNNEILLSREFYILSIDIFKTLSLRVEGRPNGSDFLNECYGNYVKLCEKSTLSHKMKKDELLKIETQTRDDDEESVYSSSTLDSPRSPNVILTQKNEF